MRCSQPLTVPPLLACCSARVKAINSIGESPWSPVASYTTQATVPQQPEPPVVWQINSSSLALQWQPPADNGSPITAYDLEMDEGEGEFRRVYHGSATSFTATGLLGGSVMRYAALPAHPCLPAPTHPRALHWHAGSACGQKTRLAAACGARRARPAPLLRCQGRPRGLRAWGAASPSSA